MMTLYPNLQESSYVVIEVHGNVSYLCLGSKYTFVSNFIDYHYNKGRFSVYRLSD